MPMPALTRYAICFDAFRCATLIAWHVIHIQLHAYADAFRHYFAEIISSLPMPPFRRHTRHDADFAASATIFSLISALFAAAYDAPVFLPCRHAAAIIFALRCAAEAQSFDARATLRRAAAVFGKRRRG